MHPSSSEDILYTVRITFLRVANVPVSDIHNLSCDPYIQATLSVPVLSPGDPQGDPGPQTLSYRTHTRHRSLNPEFNSSWIVSGIPKSGFVLSVHLKDEDTGKFDDRLAKSIVQIPPINASKAVLEGDWDSGEMEYKMHKRKGTVMSKVFTCFAVAATLRKVDHRVRLWVHIKVLGRAENQKDRRIYTVGPPRYFRHFSPLIGKYLTANSPDEQPSSSNSHSESTIKPSAFIANRIQLVGPVPQTLRHRYVGFAPFVKLMFKKRGITGMLLHHALHKQHRAIYKWDRNVVWGVIDEDEGRVQHNTKEGVNMENESGGQDGGKARDRKSEASVALAQQFLRMTSHGTKGRIFTYVIMLDGEFRFTETGDQWAIEFLSKHTMHSDVAVEIAYSGEFFVRPLHQSCRRSTPNSNGPPTSDSDNKEEEFDESNPPDDPSCYELVIDNDSGTYRPRADLLPMLRSFLSSPRNFGALGRITALNAFDDRLKKWKEERKKAKKGEKVAQAGSVSSSASSSVSSLSDMGMDGTSQGERVKVGDMRAVVEEDAKRARENDDHDKQAGKEEGEAGKGTSRRCDGPSF